ncbi:hypothetical protein [Butyrivibrio sp. JL13D10]|uniref:hypothetical protein n=1 Tax=Butyrivibrio sp. JL13D10 TaxID=3236815 RepID=UPI0038B58D7C
MKKIKIFGSSDCYGLTDELSFTLRMKVELRDSIDEKCLKEAVAQLEERFKYLKVSLKKNIKEFYYTENNKPWVVVHSDVAIPLNGTESNDQLIAFSYYENSIYVNVWHGQLDGTGLYALVEALVYFYCKRRYDEDISFPNQAHYDGDILDEEYLDAYLEYYKRCKAEKRRFYDAPPSQKTSSNVMKLNKMGLVKSGNRSSFKLRIPQKDLMKYCSSADGSPVTAVALMVADAIYRIHGDSDRMISIGIPVNLRPAMGFKVTRSSTFSQIYIQYNDKIRTKDFETQGTICRGTVIRYSDERLIQKNTMKYCKMLRLLTLIPLTCVKQFFAGIVADQMKRIQTASVTYVGRAQYGDMAKYITGFYTDVDAYGLGFQAVLAAMDDAFYITIDQDWDNKVYIESFLKVLVERGLSYEITYDGVNDIPVMRNV